MKKNETFPALLLFIEIKSREYVEPKRSRRRKGEKVGFPRKKFLATLYELYDSSATNIAKAVNAELPKGTRKATEKIISVWRIEEDYKAAVKKHGEEFVQWIAPRIVADWQSAKKGEDIRHSYFIDSHLWSWAVRGPLFAWSIGQGKEIARFVLILFGTDDMVTDALGDWLKNWFAWMKERLSGSKLTQKDKAEMLTIADFAEMYIARKQEEGRLRR